MQLKLSKLMVFINVDHILQLLVLHKLQRIVKIVLKMRIHFVGLINKENVRVMIQILVLEFLLKFVPI